MSFIEEILPLLNQERVATFSSVLNAVKNYQLYKALCKKKGGVFAPVNKHLHDLRSPLQNLGKEKGDIAHYLTAGSFLEEVWAKTNPGMRVRE